ncbi:hypothetical protein B0H13DRAFT_1851190 [Mycena leptocephala]|nr:hypothetical protein B0H13DRAFT_1851190 [Mycena leptocephala]
MEYNLNYGRYGNAAYLLGLGRMPPPQSRDYAVANMNNVLDSGLFDPAHPQYSEPPALAQHQQLAARLNLDVHIPCLVPGKSDIVTKILTFDIKGTIPNDFLDRVCATVGKTRDAAELGWKSCDAKKKEAPKALRDVNDVTHAWNAHERLLKSTRRTKPVYMEIVDMAPAEEAAPIKSAPKTYETAYSDELKIVKDKLKCATHRGPNRWCYVSPVAGDGGRHIELGFEEISLWAKMMHDDPEVDKDCALPPNVLHLDRLREKTEARRQRKQKTSPTTEVHVHYGNEQAEAQGGRKRGHEEVAGHNVSDSDDDEQSSIPIRQILTELHEKMPDLDILQYEDALRAKKIVYAQTVADFDRDYFINSIGMADGVVGPFMRHAKRSLKKDKKDKKRARQGGDKENEPVAV